MNRLFDPACVTMRITINKLYFIPKRVVSGVVGVFSNGGGLGTSESDASVMLLNSLLHAVLFSVFTSAPNVRLVTKPSVIFKEKKTSVSCSCYVMVIGLSGVQFGL